VLVKSEDEDIAVLQPDPEPLYKPDYPKLHQHWFEAEKIGTWVQVLGYAADVDADFVHHRNCNISNIYNRFGLMVLNGHVYPGDSGGPVRNDAGHVIGITTFRSETRQGDAMVRPISRLCKLLDDEKIPFDVTVGSGHLAKRALDSLVDQPNVQPVLDVIRRYGSTFANASSQIAVLHAYKKAHDLLHEVQFIHDGLGTAVDHFPYEDWAKRLVGMYVFQLREHVSDADDILRARLKQTSELVAVREQLGEACHELEDAAERDDRIACQRAIRMLYIMLLGPEQSNFNALLKAAARDLNMKDLIDAMQNVQETIFAETNSDTSDEFQLGIDDIKELDKELTAQIAEHDKWQLVDNILRPLDKNSPKLLSDLELVQRRLMSNIRAFCNVSQAAQTEAVAHAPSSSWADFARKVRYTLFSVQPLRSLWRYGSLLLRKSNHRDIEKRRTPPRDFSVQVNWATRMEQETANLEYALSLRNPKRTSEHFELLWRHVTERFNRVDKRLLLLCERISKVRNPLGLLVEKWHDNLDLT
jgi:hypothetical protein